MVYYNDNDAYCCAWLRELITARLIPDGYVDERPIEEVEPADVEGYTHCHFFAGLGGWPYALRLAGWPRDRPIWTGSCPCQPFSVAGRREGVDDPRHLWPHFYRIIRGIRPPVIMGEQVAAKAGYAWFDGVQADMEAEGYSCRAVDIPACSVNAPHIRNRLYWVGDTYDTERGSSKPRGNQHHRQAARRCEGDSDVEISGRNGFWDSYESAGPDPKGKYRRVGSGVRLMGHGIPARVPKLRALGNSIVPQVAAEVIRAWMEVTS